MNAKVYPRPPIVEAVVEFGFAEKLDQQALLDGLGAKLVARYGGAKKRQSRIDASIKIEADALETSARRETATVFLTSVDGLRLVGCGTKSLSIHVLAPYPGWERFVELVNEASDNAPEPVRTSPLARVSVRYIDRIPLPANAGSLTNFLRTLPERPPAMPNVLSAFHTVTQASDPVDGTQALLTVAGIPSDSKDVGGELVYDLLLRRVSDVLGSLADGKWRAVVDELHARQRQIFEESITDRMRELFQ